MRPLTLSRGAATQLLVLCSVSLAAACGAEDPPQEASPWMLDPWSFTEPVDSGPDVSEPLDMTPSPDLPEPIDQGPPPPIDQGPPPPSVEPDLPAAAPRIGDACSASTQCPNEFNRICILEDAWPGGYCSTEGFCEQRTCFAAGGRCVTDPVLEEAEAFCARECESAEDCREGYECRVPLSSPGANTDQRFCLPPAPEPPAPVVAIDGEGCVSDADCGGGTCLTEEEGWPGGYCTTVGCRTRVDCASEGGVDNRCYINSQGPNLCVRICTSRADCREDYVCEAVGGGIGACVPNPTAPLDIDLTAYPFTVTCGAPTTDQYTFSYDIAPTTTVYAVTTLALDGRQIFPLSTTFPSGRNTGFTRGPNGFQSTTAQLFGWVSPLIHPATPALAGDLEAGTHQHTLYAESTNVCHYVLEESSEGDTIDLNIYLVGVRNMDAASAPNNANMQAMLAQFSTIYQSFGVSIGQIRYIDITGADAQQYRVIRSEGDIADLVSLSTLPGPTLSEALSVNVFFVRSIALGGGTLGISQGLPGPPGLHGLGSSGVVFTSEYLGQSFMDTDGSIVSGNGYTGVVLAHEVGHYLGLFHTSEQGGQGQDPLDDTPFCSRQNFPNNCPDINNLMFPFAGFNNTQVTPGQRFSIKSNPLTKASGGAP